MLTYTVDSSFGYLWSGIRVEVYIVFMRNSSHPKKHSLVKGLRVGVEGGVKSREAVMAKSDRVQKRARVT